MLNMVEILSPLPPEDCLTRLQEATDSEGLLFLSRFGSRPVVGHVSGRIVKLRKRIAYGNAFQTILIGKLEEHHCGTVFRGKTGMRGLVSWFMKAWFCGVILLGGPLSVIAVGQMLGIRIGQPIEGNVPLPLVAVIPLALLAFGFGLMCISLWLARDEGQFLVDYVAEAIGGESRGERNTESRSRFWDSFRASAR